MHTMAIHSLWTLQLSELHSGPMMMTLLKPLMIAVAVVDVVATGV